MTKLTLALENKVLSESVLNNQRITIGSKLICDIYFAI